MTHEEWAAAERTAAQEAAIAHEREVAAREARDPILAWLDAAPIGDMGTEAALAAAVRAVAEIHHAHRYPARRGNDGSTFHFCDACYNPWPCDTRAEIAEALGVTP